MRFYSAGQEELYIKKLDSIVGRIEKVLSRNLIELNSAEKLLLDYSILVEEILSNDNLLKNANYDWGEVISECYEPAYEELIFELEYLTSQRKSERSSN